MLAVIAFLASVVGLIAVVGLVVQAIRRRPLRRWVIAAGISVAVVVAAAIASPSPDTTSSNEQTNRTPPAASTPARTEETTAQRTTAEETTTNETTAGETTTRDPTTGWQRKVVRSMKTDSDGTFDADITVPKDAADWDAAYTTLRAATDPFDNFPAIAPFSVGAHL